jgi:hypothetical protein
MPSAAPESSSSAGSSSSTGSRAPDKPFTCGAHDSYVPANPAFQFHSGKKYL